MENFSQFQHHQQGDRVDDQCLRRIEAVEQQQDLATIWEDVQDIGVDNNVYPGGERQDSLDKERLIL